MRADSLTVLQLYLLGSVATILEMLESVVKRMLLNSALKGPSDCKEAAALSKDVLRCVTTMLGGQCVMTSGMMMMLRLSVDN